MCDDSHFAVIAYSFLSFREKRKMHGKPGWTCKFPPICITISCYFALAFQTKFHFYISVSNLAQITLLLRRLLFFNAFVVALNILFLVPEKITDEITTNNNNNNNNKKAKKILLKLNFVSTKNSVNKTTSTELLLIKSGVTSKFI